MVMGGAKSHAVARKSVPHPPPLPAALYWDAHGTLADDMGCYAGPDVDLAVALCLRDLQGEQQHLQDQV